MPTYTTETSTNLDGIERFAVISDDQQYRYLLSRRWGGGQKLLWIMLNPSTADGLVDDPTIRRCMGFAQREKFGGIEVVNLFALRCTQPEELLTHREPRGPENVHYVREALGRVGSLKIAICAWGSFWSKGRRIPVEELAQDAGVDLVCLGLTKNGSPRHPLYLAADTRFEPFG